MSTPHVLLRTGGVLALVGALATEPRSQGYGVSGSGGEQLGISVDGAGDVIAGAPFHGSGGLTDRGAVWVFSGWSGVVLGLVPGTAAGDRLGSSVAALGDVNGNGVPDLAVGAPHADPFGTDSGTVLILSGSPLGTWVQGMTGLPGELLGAAVGATGDVNGDGFSDWIAGAPAASSSDGRAWVQFVRPAWWQLYGSGWPGTLGVPVQALSGLPLYGSITTWTVQNSRGAPTAGLIVVGLGPANIPTSKGGAFLVNPLLFQVVSIPAGGLSMSFTPFFSSSAAPFYVQVLQVDPGASNGLSFTKGMEISFGNAWPG